MQTQAQIYRSVRHQHPALPALSAWQHAGQKLEVDRWITVPLTMSFQRCRKATARSAMPSSITIS